MNNPSSARRVRTYCVPIVLAMMVPQLGSAQGKLVPSPVDMHEIRSESVDQTFRIQVAVPMRAEGSTDRYPVLYLTDTSSPMDMLVDAVDIMAMSGEIPPLIVVGIGYPVESMIQTLTVRTRDLTPVSDPTLGSQGIYDNLIEGVVQPSSHAQGGGGPDFLRFIAEELIPFVDRRYPTTDDRTYFGDSLGGLFGLYVLLERPQTFARYIIGSPSTWVAEEWIMKRAEEVVARRSDLPARVFMAAGGKEEVGDQLASFRMVTNVGRLESLFNTRDFPSFSLTTHIFPDESHTSVAYMNLLRGLHKVHDPTPSFLMEATLEAMSDGSRNNDSF